MSNTHSVSSTSDTRSKVLLTILNSKLGLKLKSPGCKSTIQLGICPIPFLLRSPVPEAFLVTYSVVMMASLTRCLLCAGDYSTCFHLLICAPALQPKTTRNTSIAERWFAQFVAVRKTHSRELGGVAGEGVRRDL